MYVLPVNFEKSFSDLHYSIKYDDRQIYFLYFKLKTTTKGDDCNENSRNQRRQFLAQVPAY